MEDTIFKLPPNLTFCFTLSSIPLYAVIKAFIFTQTLLLCGRAMIFKGSCVTRNLKVPGITRQPLLSWGPMQYPSGRRASHIGLAQLCTRGGQALQPLLREASPRRGSLPGWQADATSGQRVSEASKRKPGSRYLASAAALRPACQGFLLQDL